MCGTSATTAAVIKVRCVCVFRYCLAMEQETGRTDVRTLIQYHVLMTARTRLEYCTLVQGNAGKHAFL